MKILSANKFEKEKIKINNKSEFRKELFPLYKTLLLKLNSKSALARKYGMCRAGFYTEKYISAIRQLEIINDVYIDLLNVHCIKRDVKDAYQYIFHAIKNYNNKYIESNTKIPLNTIRRNLLFYKGKTKLTMLSQVNKFLKNELNGNIDYWNKADKIASKYCEVIDL
jgi:hypothetical protein